jgi:hypothetical protein
MGDASIRWIVAQAARAANAKAAAHQCIDHA